MEAENRERIAEAVRAESEGGAITCKEALALAERLGVEPPLVGQSADEEHIKIVECQLGCFGRRRR